MALYPTIGTVVQFSRIQKQLLQPIQDQPLLYFNNTNKYYNKVDDDNKKANEKAIESEADSTNQKQKRLPSKLVRTKKSIDGRIKHITTTKVATMKRSNKNNSDKLITAFVDHRINKQKRRIYCN